MRESIRDRYATKSERRLEREKLPNVWVIIAVVCFASFVIHNGPCFIMWHFPQTIEFFRPHQEQIDQLKERIEALEEKAKQEETK